MAEPHDILVAPSRRKQQYGYLAEDFVLANLRHHVHPVHLRHHQIRQHQAKGVRCSFEFFECHKTVLGQFDAHLPTIQHFFEDLAIDRVVVNDEYFHAPQQNRLAALGHRSTQTIAGCKVERAAHPLFAFDPDAALHHLDQLLRNRQPEPRTAKAPRGRAVDLAKRVENLRLFLRRDANPRIAHRYMQANRITQFFFQHHIDYDLAALGELEGVAHQVDHHLPQSTRIPNETIRHIRRNMTD